MGKVPNRYLVERRRASTRERKRGQARRQERGREDKRDDEREEERTSATTREKRTFYQSRDGTCAGRENLDQLNGNDLFILPFDNVSDRLVHQDRGENLHWWLTSSMKK